MQSASKQTLLKSITPKGVVGFVMNSLQSVFSDLFFGVLYLLIFDFLIQYNLSPIVVILCLLFVTIYFIFCIPLWGRWMESCVNTYKTKLSEHVFDYALRRHSQVHSGEVLSLLQHDVDNVSQIPGWSLAVLFQAIISGITASIIIGFISWKLLGFLLLIGLIPVFLDMIFARKMRKLTEEIRILIDKKIKDIVDFINNMIIVKVFRYDNVICNKIIDTTRRIYKKELHTCAIENVTEMISDSFFSGIFKAFVLVYGMYLVINHEITIGSLLLSFSMVEGIAFFMGYMGGYIKDLQKILVSIRRVDNFAQENDLYTDHVSQSNNLITDIIIRNLSFKYKDSDCFVLENINLSFHFPGQYIITGKNGCGKSTLLKLIYGLYEPDIGEIHITYANTPAPKTCYVSQQPLVIAGSLRNNLKTDSSDITDDAILKAIHCVGLSEWVNKLDSGLDYELDENGDNISKGQKMRLSIARSLVHNPQLLILDEPDANLDKETSQALIDSIHNNYNCSIILVTHTSSKILNSDINWQTINLD